MSVPKLASILALVLVIVFIPLSTISAKAADIHGPRDLPNRQMGLNIHGTVPDILPSVGSFYSQINSHITETVDGLIRGARGMRARSITFDYEILHTDCTVSVLIRASISSLISHTLVRSVNFCPHTGELLTARQVSHIDVIPLAERILREQLRRSPEFFYRTQSINMEQQAFFKTEDGITFLFDEFQLSSLVSGVFPLELLYSHMQTASIGIDQLLPNDHAYNLKMVPLRTVAQQLGYNVEWVNGRVEVSLDTAEGRQLLIWVYPDVNEYRMQVHMQEHTRSLEAAPYNRHGNIYVPITFFDQILPLSIYSIDAFGNITFLAYLG